jgi:hypothetical protein
VNRLFLTVDADLSQDALEEALIMFITEKVEGQVVRSPREYTLNVSQRAYNAALTLMAFDLKKTIVPLGTAIELKIETGLVGENWFIASEGFPFVVGSWHDGDQSQNPRYA